MDPKISYETVKAVKPFIAEEDRAAYEQEWRDLNAIDERDGTNGLLDAALEDIEPDLDYE